MYGIDVCELDGSVDWTAVKNSGKTFAFVKATEGVSIKDKAFAYHWKTLKMDGIIRGAYHFFHPSYSDPVAQAQEFLKTVGKLEPGDFPPVLDMEVTDGASTAKIINTMKKWLAEVEKILLQQTGKKIKPIIYTYSNFWIETLGNPSDFAAYPLWIADYGDAPPLVPSAWGDANWLIHQYAGDASYVTGVDGEADLNVFNPIQQKSAIPRVLDVQQRLKNLKKPEFDPGNIDGDFGLKTKNAVIAFQKSQKLQADGVIGPKTWVTLLWT